MRRLKAVTLMATFLAAALAAPHSAAAQITARPDDPQAVYLDAPAFNAKGDGQADDTAALQAAINAVQTTNHRGIVFVPEGRYRITHPVYVWAGIRLIGFGQKRPTFVLADNTPGYQGDGTLPPGGGGSPPAPKYMLQFVSEPPRPRRPAPSSAPATAPTTTSQPAPQLGAGPLPIPDGNPGSFYSAMNNINIEIGAGNPAAVGCRFHVAQHCFLSNIDFHIGSGRAGIDGAGNESENCRFFGGEWGIVTGSTAPSWPFLLIDSKFEGQRQAGIKTDYAGMTLIRCNFKDAPVAVEITEKKWEALFMKDCRLENIFASGIIIGDEASPETRINLENIICRKTPVFATLKPSGKTIGGAIQQGKQSLAPASQYEVKQFSFGLRIPEIGGKPEMKTTSEMIQIDDSSADVPPPVPSDLPGLPPSTTWVNVTTLGLKGDNATDNTAALREAIADHQTLYFPIGRYRVSDTITLRPDSILIGLHPMATQIVLPDNTPAYAGEGEPKPLLEAPKEGTCIVTGLGLDAGNNPRAIAALWMAGKNSYMNDVKFVGGHGTFTPQGARVPTYNGNRAQGIPATGDADPAKKWDSIPPSLWITKGGGGTFKDIWSANPQAQAGLLISDTTTEGRLYAVSVEHHVTVEVKLSHVANWRIYALQMEEERLEGPKAIALDLDRCRNITFGNLWFFRMATPPGTYAARLKDCTDLQIKGVRNYSPKGDTTFQTTFYDANHEKLEPAKDIGWLTVGNQEPAQQ